MYYQEKFRNKVPINSSLYFLTEGFFKINIKNKNGSHQELPVYDLMQMLLNQKKPKLVLNTTPVLKAKAKL